MSNNSYPKRSLSLLLAFIDKDYRISLDQHMHVIGRLHFVRSVAAPLSEQLEAMASVFDAREPDDSFKPDARSYPQALLTDLCGIDAIGILVGGWAAKSTL